MTDMAVTKKYLNELTYKVLGAAIEVHRFLGPCLLESVYEKCFCRELTLRGINFIRQKTVQLDYKGIDVEVDLRFDVLVEDVLMVELKTVEAFAPVHEAILLTYMRLLEKPKGILINFHCVNIFKEGQKTLVNDWFRKLPEE